MKSLLDLIKALYGPKAISSTIGTRTNVIRLPSGKLQRYLKEGLNIEAASDNAAQNAYNEMKELIPEVAKMNDSERLIFEGNLRRLKNKLEASGILPKQTVTKEAEVVSMETKEPVTGENLKKLIEEKGTVNPPTTLSGQLEGQGKKLENLGKKIDEEFIAGKKKKTAGEILEEYFTSYKSMKEVEDQALVRAVAREIMYRDLKAGKLKVPKDVEDVIRGIGPANRDVLDEFNQWYGFAAIEDLHDNAHRFYTMSSPQEAVDFIKKNKYSNWEQVYQPREKPIKEYMTPGEFQDMLKDATVNKYGMVAPKASESLDKETAKEIYDFYLKSGDRKLIQDEITGITEGKKFDVYKVEDRNKIIDILTDILKKLGPPAVAGGVGLEYLAEKTTPQTEGGTQQSLGLDYLTGMEPSEGYADGGMVERENYAFGSLLKKFIGQFKDIVSPATQPTTPVTPEVPLTVAERYNKYLSQPSASNVDLGGGGLSDLFRRLISKVSVANPQTTASTNDQLYNLYRSGVEGKADGGRIGFKTGGGKKILDLINKANKELKAKKSMETVDLKTGEVGPPKEPVMTAENKLRKLTQDEIADYEELIGRNSEEWMSEGTVEEAEKALKRSKAEEAYYLQQYKTGQLDPKPGEKSQSRMRFLQKKAEEAADVKDRRLFTLDEMEELDELERTFNKKNTSAGGFDFNDPEIKAQMEKAMQEGNKRSKEMRAMGLDPAKSKDYDEYIKIKEASGDKNFNKYFEDLEIKTKFKGVISDDLLEQILIDDNPQRKAEVVAAIEQGLKMQEKGMSPEEIVNILKNTTRTKQAQGGSIGLNYLMGF